MPSTSSSAPFPAPARWTRGLAAIADESNKVLRDLGPDIQWVHSYVTDDKITCVYLAPNEEIVRSTAAAAASRRRGARGRSVIDPTTAEVR